MEVDNKLESESEEDDGENDEEGNKLGESEEEEDEDEGLISETSESSVERNYMTILHFVNIDRRPFLTTSLLHNSSPEPDGGL